MLRGKGGVFPIPRMREKKARSRKKRPLPTEKKLEKRGKKER